MAKAKATESPHLGAAHPGGVAAAGGIVVRQVAREDSRDVVLEAVLTLSPADFKQGKEKAWAKSLFVTALYGPAFTMYAGNVQEHRVLFADDLKVARVGEHVTMTVELKLFACLPELPAAAAAYRVFVTARQYRSSPLMLELGPGRGRDKK